MHKVILICLELSNLLTSLVQIFSEWNLKIPFDFSDYPTDIELNFTVIPRRIVAGQIQEFLRDDRVSKSPLHCGLSRQWNILFTTHLKTKNSRFEKNSNSWNFLWITDLTLTSWHRDNVTPRHLDTLTPWHRDNVTLWDRDTVTPWHRDTVTKWHYVTVTSWHRDTVTPWHRDTVTPHRDKVTLCYSDTVTL